MTHSKISDFCYTYRKFGLRRTAGYQTEKNQYQHLVLYLRVENQSNFFLLDLRNIFILSKLERRLLGKLFFDVYI